VNYNPADHYLHTLAIVPGEEHICRDRISNICDAFEESDVGIQLQKEVIMQKGNSIGIPGVDDNEDRTPYKANVWQQFKALLWRSWITSINEPLTFQVRVIQTVV
jgi:hypothetical protein